MDLPKRQFAAVNERLTVLFIGLVAAAHVLIFSATFPFFNSVDEQVQFDLVVRYAQGDPPHTLASVCDEALPYIVIFSSAEYVWAPESRPGGKFAPPPWTLPPGQIAAALAPREKYWRETVKNHEISQPPLYYAVAGAWWRLCKAAGLHDGVLLYMLRFLNAFFVAALAWTGWFTAKTIFPENKFIRIAVPAIIACLPQTMFYAVNNDILSPLFFGATFVLLLKFWNTENLPSGRAIVTGLAFAGTFLTKISNLPLLAAAGIFLALIISRLARGGKIRPSAPRWQSCCCAPACQWPRGWPGAKSTSAT